MADTHTEVLPDVVQRVVERIVEVAHPTRVVLFGSAARGEMGRDSDLYMLVIVRGPVHRGDFAGRIYGNLRGVGAPVDVVVVTEEDVSAYGHRVGSIIRPALREGVVVYEG